MDATLDAFLNEINEIAPLKQKENEWKECFDSRSGFSYYWNTKTDEVTWEEPPGFTPSKSKSNYSMKGTNFPSVPPEIVNNAKDTVKIYKIAANCNTLINSTKPSSKPSKQETEKAPKKFRKSCDSDDEKVILISSYGSDSESEDEKRNSQSSNIKANESDEENDILSTVKKRAEQLKMLGQNDVMGSSKNKFENTATSSKTTIKEPLSGFSLVPGYDSNSDEENESVETKLHETGQSIPEQVPTHSTLFPIMESPDVNDFIAEPETIAETSENTPENTFDSRSFQRKRRLGINFMPIQRNMHPPAPDNFGEGRRGLGFASSTNDDKPSCNMNTSTTVYPNFKSAGLEFVKQESNENSAKENDETIDIDTLKSSYEILHEKLSFLCEGNKDLMPVQIILIQIETLYGALKAEGLKPSYLHDWLDGTNEDLLKLEKEAAPEGWLLQWDRSQKRYYYHNPSTGQGQWEYPQPDVVRQEEAMDISTTPPPSETEQTSVEVQPPLPPSPPRKSPSPPPPPIISEQEVMPEPPNAPKITASEVNIEPLPPGVDSSESMNNPVKTTPPNSDINSAFDSFYSELAAIENTSNASSPSSISEQTLKTENNSQEPLPEEIPKKKKKKVKMGQGLSLKKKDVSKLVEKWKNVQKNY